jgi:hypothetical protein
MRTVLVRVQPPQPNYFFKHKSVRPFGLFVYLWRTLRLELRDWIFAPSLLQICLDLFLP